MVDDEVLEPVLVDVAVAGRTIMTSIASNVHIHGPTHVRRKREVRCGNENQVEVIPHQAEGDQLDREPLQAVCKDRQKCFIISGFAKDNRPFVSAVEHMLGVAGGSHTAVSRHDESAVGCSRPGPRRKGDSHD
jgi:hypothetical protein